MRDPRQRLPDAVAGEAARDRIELPHQLDHPAPSIKERTRTLGIGTTNCPPHSRMCAICSVISAAMFHGQDQEVVGPRLRHVLRRMDREPHARQPRPLLVRVAVDDVVDEVRADPAVVEERRSLRSRAVGGHGLAVPLHADEELEQVALHRPDGLPERLVGLDPVEPGGPLALLQRLDRLAGAALLGVAREDPQRAAVRRQLLDVEEREAVLAEQALHHEQRPVRVVLVVDRVELALLDQLQEMRELHRHDASRLQHHAQSLDEVVHRRDVGEDVVADHEVRGLALVHEPGGELAPEELHAARDSPPSAAAAVPAVGSMPSTGTPRSTKNWSR